MWLLEIWPQNSFCLPRSVSMRSKTSNSYPLHHSNNSNLGMISNSSRNLTMSEEKPKNGEWLGVSEEGKWVVMPQ